MENQPPEEKKNVYLISGLVFLVLFVLPLGSIYFLSSGKDYRMTSLSELQDKGMVKDFELKNQNNLSVSPDVLKGRVAVVNFLSENDSLAKYQTDRIAKVHQNYNSTEDVLFLSFVKNDSNLNLIDKASALGISDHKQWYLMGADEQKWASLPQYFKIEDAATGVALVDTSMTIRRHYNINDNPEMGRLVEQIAIVIPKQPRRGM